MNASTNIPMDDRIRRLRSLVLRFSPGRGVLVDCFPTQIVVSPDALDQFRRTAGIVRVQGKGLIGTVLTVTAANGEAVYELTDRCLLADGKQTRAWVATRRSWKLKIAGLPVEVQVYGLDDLPRLFDAWPLAVALKTEVLEPPQSWWPHVTWNKDAVIFAADGCEALYRIFGRHPGYEEPPAYVAQRERLRMPDKTDVTLPPARLANTAAF